MTPVMCAWPVLPAGAEQVWWHLFLVLICISLVFSQVERLSTRSSGICSSSSVKCPLTSGLFFPWAVCVFLFISLS